MKLNNAEASYTYQQIWFFSWWEKSLQFQTLPNTWRTGNLVLFKDITFQRHSLDQECDSAHAFWASHTFSSFTILLWLDSITEVRLKSVTQVKLLEICWNANIVLKLGLEKNGLRWEQTFKSSSSWAVLWYTSPILWDFLTLQALHSRCVRFLSHTEPT